MMESVVIKNIDGLREGGIPRKVAKHCRKEEQ